MNYMIEGCFTLRNHRGALRTWADAALEAIKKMCEDSATVCLPAAHVQRSCHRNTDEWLLLGPRVDCAEHAGFQDNAPGAHRRLRESGPGFPAVPLEEFVEPQVVHATRDRGGNAVEHQTLQSVPLGSLRNNNQISHLGPLNGHYR